jgi:hypothetical protein
MQFLRSRRSILLWSVALGFVFLVALFLCSTRYERPMIFYYGASPEVPQGKAFRILNPFRRRKDEANAEWLIRDLRTNKCEQIVRERLGADPAQICPLLRYNERAVLIWLDPERDNGEWRKTRELYYDLPESRSRLVVGFGDSEAGWGVNTVSLVR